MQPIENIKEAAREWLATLMHYSILCKIEQKNK